MKKIFVINKSAHDFSDALRFGELVYLSEGSYDPYSVAHMHRVFKKMMEDSSPTDYILPTGLSIMQSVACAIFAAKHGRLNLLMFKDGRYIERKLILEDTCIQEQSQKPQR